MPPVGFEPKNSAGKRPKIYALDRAAPGTGDVTSDTGEIQSNESKSIRNLLPYVHIFATLT